jgi:hypothetical protein
MEAEKSMTKEDRKKHWAEVGKAVTQLFMRVRLETVYFSAGVLMSNCCPQHWDIDEVSLTNWDVYMRTSGPMAARAASRARQRRLPATP